MVELRRWTDAGGQEWVCGASDHGPFCRLCEVVNDTMRGLLQLVEDERMEMKMAQDGLKFKLTEKGRVWADHLIQTKPELADLFIRMHDQSDGSGERDGTDDKGERDG